MVGMMSPVEQILVIDDESGICELIAATARKLVLCCITSTTAEAFLEKLTPDTTLVLMDLMMPGMDGVELLRLLGEKQCKARIVLMSGTDTRIMETAEQFAQSIGLTVAGRLPKPFRLADLEAVLKMHNAPVKPRSSRQKNHALNLNADLYSGIQRNEFVLHYQPQIDLANSKITGMEALVRWQHPERGLIYPDDFIAQAETLGLIDQLGWFVANLGMEEICLFADKNGSVPMLSINVSVHSLRDLKFPEKYMSLLEKNGVAPENTILEITESGLIQELSTTLDVLTRLRLKGVQLSIDDFGTGYSMMQQLRNMPATELKIDKSFVQNMHATASNRIMVQKTIEIGHELGMKVVAEGVETPDQLAFLHVNSCDIAQGYLFSRPLPANEMQTWLHDYRSSHAV
jgi:EAL domain-containing protein (putative c-di-GMP-specific phosphodiesterase class I)/ActR/RegA family two-component response regulator